MILHTSFSNSSQRTASKKGGGPKKIASVYDVLVPNRLRYGKVSILNRQEYDFTETYRIVDTEAMAASAMRKKQALIQKDGYKLVSNNQKNVEYIKKRLLEIQYVTGQSFDSLIEDIVRCIVYNHNSFVFKVRDKKSSTGNATVNYKEPIAGFYVLPEFKVSIVEDIYTEVSGYRYNMQNMFYKMISLDDMYHFYVDKRSGMHVGTPPLEAVKDDIMSLRQIEESLERLIYKLTVPLMHLKVGSENKPASIDRVTGRSEVDIYNDLMLNMDEAGGITTSERVDIKLIGAESQALNLTNPIDHYVDRVLIGLNVSEVDLGVGESTTGGAAVIISNSLKQNVEMYQHIIENFVTNTIITELLLESDDHKDDLFLQEVDKVLFRFEKTDMANKIKMESHMINETQNGLLMPNEYRVATGRKPMTDKELEYYYPVMGPAGQPDPVGMNTNNKAKANTTKAVTAPKNQYNISDKLTTYVQLIKSDSRELANEILYIDIKDQLETDIMKEKLHLGISSLTNTLETYILQKIPLDIAVKTVNSVLTSLLYDIYTGKE